jgi:hypothetical protein
MGACSIEVISITELPCWARHILFWANQHQTLIAGGIALIAALLTVRAIRAQIRQAEDAEKKRVDIERNALRARLAFELSYLRVYISEYFQILKAIECAADIDGTLDDDYVILTSEGQKVPELRKQCVVTVSELISREADDITRHRLTILLRELQVSRSRLLAWRGESGAFRRVETQALQMKGVHAIVDSLFPYARFERETAAAIAESPFHFMSGRPEPDTVQAWWGHVAAKWDNHIAELTNPEAALNENQCATNASASPGVSDTVKGREKPRDKKPSDSGPPPARG